MELSRRTREYMITPLMLAARKAAFMTKDKKLRWVFMRCELELVSFSDRGRDLWDRMTQEQRDELMTEYLEKQP